MTSVARKLGRRKFHVHTYEIMQETERSDGSPVVISHCTVCGALQRVVYGPARHGGDVDD